MDEEHLPGYARRDREVVDYEMYRCERTGLWFRGPRPDAADLTPGRYVTFLGAAQTFGCFCEDPFPTLVGRRLDVPVLNLGYGGAGPRFFARHPELLEIANEGAVAVVQVMSVRSEDNRLFETRGLEYLRRRSDGRRLGAEAAWKAYIEGERRPGLSGRIRSGRVVRRLRAPLVRRRARQTRANWLESYRRLVAGLRVPVVGLWFSTRRPEYRARWHSVWTAFGEFPHLVDAPTMRRLEPLADAWAYCVSARGRPQPLVSRTTGEPVTVDPSLDRPEFGGRLWTENVYYPSPEMHEDAADSLVPVVRRLL